ncbi:MAG: alpha/beta hydrolase [Dethiobacteria bacterium]|jgi:alpha/beta superfamily hydrolase
MRKIKTAFENAKGLSLEALLMFPNLEQPCPGVIICHPHPLYGGNMHNNVTTDVARALVEKGLAALLFNFRGVGRSEGNFDHGIGETEDALAALAFLAKLKEINPLQLGIIGYSFGGLVAFKAGEISKEARAIAGISPVIPSGSLQKCSKPKLIICGDQDSMVPVSGVLEKAAKMAEPKKIKIIAGADHFWAGIEHKFTSMVTDFFAGALV